MIALVNWQLLNAYVLSLDRDLVVEWEVVEEE